MRRVEVKHKEFRRAYLISTKERLIRAPWYIDLANNVALY